MDSDLSSKEGSLKKSGYDTPTSENASLKRSSHGILLEPQPTDDPKDPLNWSLTKKLTILGVVSFAALAAGTVGQANQFGMNVQAAVYGKTPIEVSYSTAANAAGVATGPLLWVPLSNYFGRTSVIFWTQLLATGMCIWSSLMTGAGDYNSFIVSRWLAGTFCSASFALGGGVILDTFFLHQRGKAYATYTAFWILGAYLAGTSSVFIVGTQSWPVQFYWVTGVIGLSAILIFFLMEDTTYDRKFGTRKSSSTLAESYITNRIATFSPGHKVIAPSPIYRSPFDTILIGVQPITLISGAFVCITFGWAVPVQTLIGVFLQLPKQAGGYGFTGVQVACFSFISWLSIVVAEVHALLLNDRVALWACKRNGGIWKPEFRLYPLMLPPLILLPFALGLFGAALQYNFTYWAIAVAFFLVSFADSIVLPITINYISECFGNHPTEVFVIVNFYRFILGATVMFFFEPWAHTVGYGWAFGMMAFFSVLGFTGTLGMWWFGPQLRSLTYIKRFVATEEGDQLFGHISPVDRESIHVPAEKP
ncbi:hypothetical protein CLAFUW4_09831 [Fulvia fulva]|uniref:Major facilitator superfamily (MFS) profile domain-containing protein n=1 Tax=Passalora fulva TaxID=5499 RepID=A0A9Q8UUM1_PASFU|nr:uncharacterized protein CLAFUR5_12409 [Fulvia fulva]KAK4615651.1 hypothetical protein CLAFUR4_09837 [Fulvia fulva]KAK4616480.1 hypothetical protein CLAFUR0_09830 [Fulvia fulva]UJO22947.1 hypothetical protein CLAFUR5_12409 [Fulvia fulva]WPV18799.1 hypothetical protein CLAFUW4_09831 [Fulvia fulva]WPV33836.1 hypothetical protein CLAFUW7_09834 [Fulvia fulva]